MTRAVSAALAALATAACAVAPIAHGQDAVTVASLSGLQTAIDNAPADGRTITLAAGVYQQTRPIRIDGRAHVTVEGATDDSADTVIQGPGIDDASLESNIRLNNADDVTIADLTLADSYYHGIQINNDSDGFTARNVHTLDNGESGFKVTSPTNGGGPAAYSDDGLIENCDIGFSRGGHRSVVEGVDLVAVKHWTLRNDHFEHILSVDGRPAYAAFAKGNSQDVVFEDNTVSDSFIGLSFGGGGTDAQFFRNGDTSAESHGGVIRDNTIDTTRDAGIYMNKADDYDIVDNTVTHSSPGAGSINIRYAQSNGRVRDNHTSGAIRLRDGATADESGNTRIADN